MGLFTAGFLTGIMACILTMLVRCAAWYERKHPEDDYWHMSIWRKEKAEQELPEKEEDGETH